MKVTASDEVIRLVCLHAAASSSAGTTALHKREDEITKLAEEVYQWVKGEEDGRRSRA